MGAVIYLGPGRDGASKPRAAVIWDSYTPERRAELMLDRRDRLAVRCSTVAAIVVLSLVGIACMTTVLP